MDHNRRPPPPPPPPQPLLPRRDNSPDTPESQPAAPAKLRRVRTGKACRRCASIKCKCIRPVEGGPCERCRRLKATCEPARPASAQQTAATTAIRVRAAPRSRTARLEARIDDLVSLLQTSRSPQPPQPQPQPPTQPQPGHLVSPQSPASAAASGPSKDFVAGIANLHSCHLDSPADQAMSSGHSQEAAGTSTTATTPAGASPYQHSLTVDEAESRLSRFREDMLPLVPFHYIPPTTTAAEISQKSPFLWLCIRVVTDPSPLERTRLALACRRDIIRRVVEEEERSLEILLGLLTFLTWNNLPFPGPGKSSRSTISLLAQVAIAVTWDLCLAIPPMSVEAASGSELAPGRFIGPKPPNIRRSESMDDRRAVLGVYLVTLNVSQKYRTADGLRWSPYLENCLAYLDKHSTVPQDKALVQIIKMHLLVNQVYQAPTVTPILQHGTDNKQGSPVPDGPRSLPVPFIESLRAELDAIVGTGPDGTGPLFDNFTVHVLYHFALLSLHETILFPSPSSQTVGQPLSLWAVSDLQRFEAYQRCLGLVKTVMDRILTWPLETFSALPSSALLPLCPMFRWLYRLTTLRDSVWDLEAARSAIDPIATLDRFIDRTKGFSAIHAKDNPDGYDVSHGRGNIVDLISASVAKFAAFKRAWQSDLAAHAQGRDAGSRTGTAIASTGCETDTIAPTLASANTGSASDALPTPPSLGTSAVSAEMPLIGDDLFYLFADGMQNYQFDFGDLFQAGPGFIGG